MNDGIFIMKLRDDNIIEGGGIIKVGSQKYQKCMRLGARNAQNLAAVQWVCLKFTDLAVGLRHMFKKNLTKHL